MIRQTIKYSLLTVGIWGLSACTNPRTITINQDRVQSAPRPMVVRPHKTPDIKEEILLGNRVDVPLNNPVLGDRIGNEGEESIQEEPITHSRNEVIERMPFPVEEYKYVRKRGRSTISGTIYLENSNTSMQVKGKKIKLWLNPVTSYSRQWYQESYLGGYKLSKTDKRLYNYLKFTYSNNDGKFNFFGVPNGDYYLTGSIACAEECGFSQQKSIRLVREISVGSGVTNVDLMKHVP